jgi:hypothetical protein
MCAALPDLSRASYLILFEREERVGEVLGLCRWTRDILLFWFLVTITPRVQGVNCKWRNGGTPSLFLSIEFSRYDFVARN